MSTPPDNLPATVDPTVAANASLTPVVESALSEGGKIRARLAHYSSIIRRQAWKIGAFVTTSLLVTFVVSSWLQPVYESTASINIDRTAPSSAAGGQAAKADFAKKNADQADEEYAATQLKIVASDPVLRPVAVKYKLLERERQLDGLTPEQAAIVKRSPITLKRLKVSRPSNTFLIQISYRSTDPQLAADVANAIAQSYIDDIYRLQATSVLRASGLVLTQLEELKARMDRSSEALARFKREHTAANHEERNISQRLEQLNADHANAEADLLKKEAAYNSVKSGSVAGQVAGQTEGLQKLDERINEAEEQAAEIKASKGPNDPGYKKEQLLLQQLQQQYQALSADAAGRAESDYNNAVAHVRLVERELARAKAEADRLSPRSAEYQQLQQEADADKTLYEEVEAKSQQAVISATQNRNTVVSDPARPSNKPVFPDIPLNLSVAGVLSCFFGIGAALVLDSRDKSIRDPEEVRRLFGTELIGILPIMKGTRSLAAASWARGPKASLAVARAGNQTEASMSSFEEAIRMLRNSILLSDVDRGLRSILVTSAAPGEGKSTAAMHLAMAHAEQGKKTLLIDADLRQPALDKRLGISDVGLGLSGVFLGETDWEDAVLQIAELPNLYLLPAGSPSSRASDLIGSSIAEILDEAVRVYDLVIVDAPPILGFAEPMHLAIAVDGVVIVATARGTTRQELRAAVSTLNRLRARLIGIVLNKLSPGAGASNGYY